MKEKKIKGFDEYEIEEAARTLRKAKELRSNKVLFDLAIKQLEKESVAAAEAVETSKKDKKMRPLSYADIMKRKK